MIRDRVCSLKANNSISFPLIHLETVEEKQMKEIRSLQGDVAQVDNEDYEKVSSVTWSTKVAKHTKYFIRGCGSKNGRSLHRMIAQPSDDMVPDHLDGNGLNNQRYNLKVCTRGENSRNTRKLRNAYDNLLCIKFVPATEPEISKYAGHRRLLKEMFK
jgi:hypothetical protein